MVTDSSLNSSTENKTGIHYPLPTTHYPWMFSTAVLGSMYVVSCNRDIEGTAAEYRHHATSEAVGIMRIRTIGYRQQIKIWNRFLTLTQIQANLS